MRPLGVAVVGLGIGEAHARSYAADPRCALRWLYDLDPDRARRLALALGTGKAASSFEVMLADPDVRIVSVASYDDAHFAQARDALRAQKHVFVEKPLCRTADELSALRAVWESAGRPHLASNLVLRGAPLYAWLKQIIDAGELGDVYAFDGEYLYGRMPKITHGWRARVEDYSVILGGGIHLVDLMLWLTGQRPASVSAVGNRICTTGTAFRYEDFVAATFRFSSGLVGRVTANFGAVHPHQHVVRVFGTKATFLYDDRGARLHGSSRSGEATPVELPPLPASKGVLVPRFVDAITSGADARDGAQREFAVVAACVAVDQALRTGSPADIEHP